MKKMLLSITLCTSLIYPCFSTEKEQESSTLKIIPVQNWRYLSPEEKAKSRIETNEERRERLLPLQIEKQRKDKEFDEWLQKEYDKARNENHEARMKSHIDHMALIRAEPFEKQMERLNELWTLFVGIGDCSSPWCIQQLKDRLETKPLKFLPLDENQAIDLPYIQRCWSDRQILYGIKMREKWIKAREKEKK